MIPALDETIRQILIGAGRLNPNEVDISFDIPTRAWSAGMSRPTLNCYLFDIRENLELRQQGWQMEKQGANAVRRHAPLRFDLTYLITAWTRAVEDEHHLLWHVLQTLVRFPTLPEEHLRGALARHDAPIYATVGRAPEALNSPSEFWTSLDNTLKPALSYVITLALERDAIPAGPPVLTTTLDFRGAGPESLLTIGGTVRDAEGAPVAGARVTLDGQGRSATSGDDGAYRLQSEPGPQTLIVQFGQRAERHAITVPGANYDIALSATNADLATESR